MGPCLRTSSTKLRVCAPSLIELYGSLFRSLLVPQRLDRIEVRSADRWNHPADQAGHYENERCDDDRAGRDQQANVRVLGVEREFAVERYPPDQNRNEVCQSNAADAADAGDHHRLSKKLR